MAKKKEPELFDDSSPFELKIVVNDSIPKDTALIGYPDKPEKMIILKLNTEDKEDDIYDAIAKGKAESESKMSKTDLILHKRVKQVVRGNVPSKSNCYKIITFKSKEGKGHSSLAKTKALAQYEKDFFIQSSTYRNLGIDEYFEFEIDVYYPSQRSDLDNSLKVVLDCLQKIGAIKNDNKCTRIVANKFLDASNPRIEFVIKKSMS